MTTAPSVAEQQPYRRFLSVRYRTPCEGYGPAHAGRQRDRGPAMTGDRSTRGTVLRATRARPDAQGPPAMPAGARRGNLP